MGDQRFPQLPCYPCPHDAACCAYGVTVDEREARAIIAAHGDGKVYRANWGEWRTRIKNGRCVFYVDGGCSIHAESYYPAVCAAFPWVDAETGGPYEYDRTICPEFVKRPELLEINPMPDRPRPEAP
jgi:hypothetical protein